MKSNTDSSALFLTNVEAYDPVTIVGRKSYLGEPHYLFAYGISPEKRLQTKIKILSAMENMQAINLLQKNKIKYVVLYKQKNPLQKQLKTVYQDKIHLILEVPLEEKK